eukprot:1201326-Amphidinium_carterae.1
MDHACSHLAVKVISKDCGELTLLCVYQNEDACVIQTIQHRSRVQTEAIPPIQAALLRSGLGSLASVERTCTVLMNTKPMVHADMSSTVRGSYLYGLGSRASGKHDVRICSTQRRQCCPSSGPRPWSRWHVAAAERYEENVFGSQRLKLTGTSLECGNIDLQPLKWSLGHLDTWVVRIWSH